VETSIHDNAATRLVKVVAVHQLKSGDIQIFTSTTAEAIQLKENKGWIGGLGEQAELVDTASPPIPSTLRIRKQLSNRCLQTTTQ
jgi:hypothetical protein